MNYQKILNEGVNFLKTSNIARPELDCELLLSKVLNKKREELLNNLKKEVNQKQHDKFKYTVQIIFKSQMNLFHRYCLQERSTKMIQNITGHLLMLIVFGKYSRFYTKYSQLEAVAIT